MGPGWRLADPKGTGWLLRGRRRGPGPLGVREGFGLSLVFFRPFFLRGYRRPRNGIRGPSQAREVRPGSDGRAGVLEGEGKETVRQGASDGSRGGGAI